MKVKWNQEYTTRGVYVFIVLAAVIVFGFLIACMPGIFSGLSDFFKIINPFLWAFALAYILNRPLLFFENKVFAFLNNKKPRPKLVRGLSVVMVSVIFVLIVIGLLWIVLPQLISSLSTLITKLPDYYEQFVVWVQGIADSMNITLPATFTNIGSDWNNLLSQASEYLKTVFPDIANAGITFTVELGTSIGNAFIALIAAIYLMLSKNTFISQIKKACFAIFPKKFANATIRIMRDSHVIFSSFISGKMLEAFIMGSLNFIIMTIINLPYALLISVLMGVFNLIPFFGPFIGAIPSTIILLIVQPSYALWFVIITLVLQQIDGQILAPKILGNSTGLTAFWVIFSIILGGGLFGVMGMLLGIPLFAVIYTLSGRYVNHRLKKRGLSTNSSDYETG